MVINIEKHDCRRTTPKIVGKHSPKSGATLSESKKDWRESNTSSTIRLSWGFYGENCKEICAWRKLWRRWSFAPVNRAPSGKKLRQKRKEIGKRERIIVSCTFDKIINWKVFCVNLLSNHTIKLFSLDFLLILCCIIARILNKGVLVATIFCSK